MSSLAQFPVERRRQIVGFQGRGEAWKDDMGTETMTVTVALAQDRSQAIPVAVEGLPPITTIDSGLEPTNDAAIALALTFIEEALVPRYLIGETLDPAVLRDLMSAFDIARSEAPPQRASLTEPVIETVLLTQVLIWRQIERLRPVSLQRSLLYQEILADCFGDDVDPSPA